MTAPLDLNALLAALQPCGDCYHEDSARCRPPRCECPCHGRHTLACRALPRAVAELTETLARVTAERDAAVAEWHHEIAHATAEQGAHVATITRLVAAEQERDALRARVDTLEAVVRALPQCECGAPATLRDVRDRLMWCDAHAPWTRRCRELLHAAALRALLGGDRG